MASVSFAADYNGRCADCKRPYTKGEEVRHNQEDKLVAEDCCGCLYGYAEDYYLEDDYR
jgi:hypothetical protein